MEVNILGRTVPVRFVSDRELDQLGDDKELLGLYDRGKIYISTSVGGDEAKRVLMHEITHAFLNISGIECILTDEQQEAVCLAMEGLVSVVTSEQLSKFLNETAE